MKIAFHGAARCVTGSKHLISLSNGKKILLDCGMFQGMGKQTIQLNHHFGFDPSEVDVMVLSHAHIDHSGLIPKLVKEGYRGKIFCTQGTKDLASVLMEDSAEIQESDIRYVNKKRAAEGLPYLQPIYTVEDARKAAQHLVAVDYNNWTKIDEDTELLYTDAGHIIGIACVHLRIMENGKLRTLTFSGDVGRYRDVILKSPQEFPQSDFIILESTYGNKLHDMHITTPDQLLDWIEKTCIKRK
ncbi:MAG: MBL fold metallo-hydrolase, partial [Bacteroidia bacterium]|nr:MBL fold metallo-hydrolase [Bacteroidia bacterium]